MNRAAIITGGGGEIGGACARHLLDAGWNVLAVDVNPAQLKGVADVAKALPGRLLMQHGDATKEDVAAAAAAYALAQFGRIDGLANVAGGAGPVKARLADELPVPAWDHVVDLNVKSAFLFSRAVLPAMRKQGFGRIVNFSSTISRGQAGTFTTVTGRLPYATSKAALIGFTSQMAKDEAEHGITVNAVLPGNILTEGLQEMGEDYIAGMARSIPAGTLGTPEDIGHLAAFLASDEARYLTGQSIVVDGGQILPESLDAVAG